MDRFHLGDVVKLKKAHPCGGFEWEIMRTGMDFRIKCLTCGRQVMISRPDFEKRVKKIIKSAQD
ncbi:MAG: DUF951 domain-containing protein [Desulfitobacteriaceae bacterium]|nr:DUF951 domain-containing protein [Desulfitobacteriaceae bacterium]MDD4751702.1 DUF951 domain-containing protein [Desulfitobacteriaceae bacterium]